MNDLLDIHYENEILFVKDKSDKQCTALKINLKHTYKFVYLQ